MKGAEVDARGLRCPLPVIRLAEVARAHGGGPDAGEPLRVTVLATDPAARHDIAAWCRMRGHPPPEVTDVGDHTAYAVVLGARPPGAAQSPSAAGG